MKPVIVIVSTIISLTTISYTSRSQSTDAVEQAERSNDRKSDDKEVNEEDANFLARVADGRMADLQQGKLASEKSANGLIRDYGKLMMKDQQMLLAQVKLLAATKNVTLPDNMSEGKSDERTDLVKESGKSFDKKFVDIMISEHERDISSFEEAAQSSDRKISQFAEKYLPLLESHLEKIKDIKDQMQ
ncbi:DUF4142 domain-containing protein [Chryseolinea sp. T2]|uniref:DUF4142 domain-containing protein n=1 Tax=Chryseolinea sp. T2 TaxID=3129255 RepID=UPI003077AAD4